MWPLTVALGFVIAYFILKFTRVQTSSEYLPGKSYYKSGPKVSPSPLPVDSALVGVGLETRVENQPPSVMDSGSPVSMVMMSPAPMVMSPAPSPMMATGNAPVTMTPVPSPSPVV